MSINASDFKIWNQPDASGVKDDFLSGTELENLTKQGERVSDWDDNKDGKVSSDEFYLSVDTINNNRLDFLEERDLQQRGTVADPPGNKKGTKNIFTGETKPGKATGHSYESQTQFKVSDFTVLDKDKSGKITASEWDRMRFDPKLFNRIAGQDAEIDINNWWDYCAAQNAAKGLAAPRPLAEDASGCKVADASGSAVADASGNAVADVSGNPVVAPVVDVDPVVDPAPAVDVEPVVDTTPDPVAETPQ